jgi:adenosine deaminase
LIVIATRKDGGDRSDISRHLALAITAADQWKEGCRVVGVDLAGWERPETRAALFATDFEPVHRVGLAVTVHAGENDDAEGIWQAVFKLNARRLGHALHLAEASDLLREVAARGIGIEMCPFANVQIKGFATGPAAGVTGRFPAYPLRTYLDAGVRVTVNTDNIGISDASLTDNLLLAAKLCPALTRMDMLRLLAHALQVAFISPADRERVVRCVEAHLTGLAAASTGAAAAASGA